MEVARDFTDDSEQTVLCTCFSWADVTADTLWEP
jgi:hypothetical protein